ncbi:MULTISPECIES: hypothetical protein [unclassified Mycobacterium]|uniref:hypothetical protein n=1 Tax=unclassified Mycobacterium TaxID=2642494 RepID=UPI00074047E9|nr:MULTISPECIES: hypothetical protein [unclassified Mycobacterium]KUH86172.1 hypothetical protein AU187_05080 [Mycobacterium sp. IS-1556]KUH86906.1 hypothetical protein AU185_20275 [Mycobacterium sp. GA-0227b]KUH92183.1 hypothetical protein AU186_06990 [Mycobacterium sp. GA-1999]
MQRIAILVGGLAVAGLVAAAPAGAEPGQVDCSPCARTTSSSGGGAGGTLPERWVANAHALGESWAKLPGRYAALPGEIVSNIASIPGKIAANYDADPTNNSPE